MPNPKVRVQTSAFDKALKTEATEYYRLSIQLSQDGFSFCIFDPRQNKYIGLQSFKFTDAGNPSSLNRILEELIPEVALLKQPYADTRIIFENRASTLIPEPLYDPGKEGAALSFNVDIAPDSRIKIDRLTISESRNIWAVPSVVDDTLNSFFPGSAVYHHSSVLIESMLMQNKNIEGDNRIYIHVRKGWFDILLFEGGRMLFYNTFDFKVREDFIYYIIYAIEQLGLNPETVRLILLGEIMKVSALYDISYKYVRHIEFAPRNSGYDYSYVFHDIPGHYYLNLLNLQQCEL